MELRSALPGLGWPAVLAPRAAAYHALWQQLTESQWLPAADVEKMQRAQLLRRLNFAAQHRPNIQEVLRQLPWQDPEVPIAKLMQALPLLTRRDLQNHADTWHDPAPISHGQVRELKTSGASGEPVTVRATSQLFQLRSALTLRGHVWHGLDFKSSFAAIRGGIRERSGNASIDAPQWGGGVSSLTVTGSSHALDITTPVNEQVMWLRARRPAILLSLPSNLEVLLSLMPAPWPGLTHVLTISETLEPALRARLESQWACKVCDKYSSEEFGTIATECAYGNYHCSEHLIVEILRDDGTACEAGETGRLVITDTWNFAMHMVRYDIRDYAVAGSTCACGRGLPVISRIMGRVRNLMTLPDGRRFWPLFGMRTYGEIAPINQMQFVQTALDEMLIRYLCDYALSGDQMKAVSERVRMQVGYPLKISFERALAPLNAGSGYKFEEFKSLVDSPLIGSVFD